EKDKHPNRNRNQCWNRKQNHFKWQCFRFFPVQQNNSDRLTHKLNQYAHHDDGCNYFFKLEKQTEHKCNCTKEKQRDMRKVFCRMQLCKNTEEISFFGCSVRNARIAKHHRKKRS